MDNSLYEMPALKHRTNFQSKMINTTTMILCRHISWREWDIVCHVNNLLIISTVDDSLSVPAMLLTLHVYSPLSSTAASLITRVFSLLIENLPAGVTCFPSFSQATSGVGTPLTGHLMMMVVLETAVTLSPTFIVTGLPSPTGILCPGLGTSMTGLMGSAND